MSDDFTISETFLTASAMLLPKDAVAAIIIDEDDRVLLQLRDDKDGIFFPHHWGCFGGAMEPGETPRAALDRELAEELGEAFAVASVETFITISFNVKPSTRPINRYFFIVRVPNAAMENIRLGEGSGWKYFVWREAMTLANIVPYDRFSLWLCFNQQRL